MYTNGNPGFRIYKRGDGIVYMYSLEQMSKKTESSFDGLSSFLTARYLTLYLALKAETANLQQIRSLLLYIRYGM